MTLPTFLLPSNIRVVPRLVLLTTYAAAMFIAACSVDVAPLSPLDDAGRADGGGMDSGGPDSGGVDSSVSDGGGRDTGMDAMQGMDSGMDAMQGMDASDDDAGGDAGVDAALDAGTDAGTDAGMDAAVIECLIDEDCEALPCYEANCAGGTCMQTPQPFGLLTGEPVHDCQAAYCDGAGQIIMLGDSLDLPADDFDFCTREACVGTSPSYLPLDDGTQLPPTSQIAGDCKVRRCAGGVTVDAINDNDVPIGTACGLGTCTNGVMGTTPVAAGLSCGSDLVCDTLGSCISCQPETLSCANDWECCGGDCFGGICGASCAVDQQDCDGIDANGCETAINTLTDCGACGAPCARDNASATCATGTCAIAACANAFGNCNNDPADGCERSLRTLSDCSSCGAACSRANATATCATGACTLGACDSTWANCDNVGSNGCETPTNTLTDCGGCNTPCAFANATSTCASGTCVRVSCDSGFQDCDNNPSNGCEAAIGTQLNCSACGDVCTGPSNRLVSCDIGVCAVGACVTGFQDCDGNNANGCEWDLINGACPCTGVADSDGDGLTNCSEIDDGDPYTDPDIFNGARVTHYPMCATSSIFGTNITCNSYDTLGEVRACNAKAAARQTLDQYSGWDWDDPSGTNNAINNTAFGYLPNWSGTNNTFQVDAQAFVNITQAGRHCFRINGTGGSGGSCGSLYVSTTDVTSFCGWAALPANTPAVVQHGDSAVCLQLAVGVYPIRWHLDRDATSTGDFHVDYCFGGSANCAPTNAIPARNLRATHALTCQVPADSCSQGTHNGHNYWFCNNPMTWTAARTACQAVGMDLAAIQNSAENNFIENAINTDHWIGLSDAMTEAVWVWAPTSTTIWNGGPNGTVVGNNYVNWNGGEPNGDNTRNCAEILTSGRWNDTTCPTTQAFICEQL